MSHLEDTQREQAVPRERSPLKNSIFPVDNQNSFPESNEASTGPPYDGSARAYNSQEMDWTFQPEPIQYPLITNGPDTQSSRDRTEAFAASVNHGELVEAPRGRDLNNSDELAVTSPENTSQFFYPPARGAGGVADHSRSSSRASSHLNLVTAHNGRLNHYRSSSASSALFLDYRGDNGSIQDFSQEVLTSHLGDHSASLMPRMKTIELYRQNAKKSNDPAVLFQYAQYILQTALMTDSAAEEAETNPKLSSSTGDLLNTSRGARVSSPLAKGSVAGRLKKLLLKEAVYYLRRLSDRGYSEAQYLLGDAHSSGALGRVDNREAFTLFQHAAKHGHAESAYRTSHCYEEGLGTGRDSRKAVEFLKAAAARHHPAAMYKLGVYSFYSRMGLPNNVNVKQAGIKWLLRATDCATELIAGAPYELAKIHFHGFEEIVIPDKPYALELYAQAAALGNIPAATLLGRFYETGEVVAQDANLSIHYYTQGALGGDPEAMLAMCAWYLVGAEPFLPVDEVEAFEWARRAATCGLVKAQFALGHFYERGIGCEPSLVEAQRYYALAAAQGDEKASTRLRALNPTAEGQTVKPKRSMGNLIMSKEKPAPTSKPAPSKKNSTNPGKLPQPQGKVIPSKATGVRTGTKGPSPVGPSPVGPSPVGPSPVGPSPPTGNTAYKGAVAGPATGKAAKSKDCVIV